MNKLNELTLRCPYCGDTAQLVGGDKIYPRHPGLHHKYFYLCGECDAYVGCYPDTRHPLGFLANRELRQCRQEAYQVFDSIWENGWLRRQDAYQWLSSRLDVPPHKCHIGQFNLAQAQTTIDESQNFIREFIRDHGMNTSTTQRRETND